MLLGCETSTNSGRMKKIATTVYITEDQQQLLKELNRRTRVPIAEFIREGIDLVLERHAAQLPGQMGLQLKPELAEPGVSLIRNSSSRNSSSVGGIVSILDESLIKLNSVPNETNS
jgi:hypothetical protein